MRTTADPIDREDRNDDHVPDVEILLGLEDGDADAKDFYKIGELAREFGLTLRSLRFYESKGLLHPVRKGNRRVYSAEDRKRLRLILLGKALGFTLMEAQELIDLYVSPRGELQRLETAVVRLEAQKLVLLGQRREIDASIETMEASIAALKTQLKSRRP